MKNSFCDIKTAYSNIPQLKKYIPDDACKVGISKAGNLKYVNRQNKIQVVQETVSHNIMAELRNILLNPLLTIENTKQQKISAEEYKKFCFDVPCPNVPKLYVMEQNLSYYRTTKKNKRITKDLTGKHGQTQTIIYEIVNRYIQDANIIATINKQIGKNVDIINKSKKNIISEFSKKSIGLACVMIELERPCAYFVVQSKELSYQEEKLVRLDQDINMPEILDWIDKQVKKIVEKKNDEIRKEEEQKYAQKINKNLVRKFQCDGYGLHFTMKPQQNKTTLAYSVECKRGDILLSLENDIKYVFENEDIKEEINDNGLIGVSILSVGKNSINKKTAELYQTLKKEKWFVQAKGELQKKIECYIEECKKICEPILNGKSWSELNYCYNLKTFSFWCENMFVKMFQMANNRKNKVFVEYKNCFVKLQNEIASVQYKDACKYIEDILHNNSIAFTYVSGCGILNGETQIIVQSDKINFNYTWIGPSYIKSISEWQKQVDINIANVLNVLKDKRENSESKIRKKYEELLDSFIATDIRKLIVKNEKNISKDAVIHYLCGMSCKSYGNISGTDAYGRYKIIPSKEVENIIESMLVNDLIKEIASQTNKKNNVLQSTNKYNDLFKLKHAQKKKKELLNLSNYNDFDAKNLYTIMIAKEELEIPDYMQLLKLISAKGFICCNYKAYIDIFRKAPDTVKTYLQMRREMSEDSYERKVIKQMLKK